MLQTCRKPNEWKTDAFIFFLKMKKCGFLLVLFACSEWLPPKRRSDRKHSKPWDRRSPQRRRRNRRKNRKSLTRRKEPGRAWKIPLKACKRAGYASGEGAGSACDRSRPRRWAYGILWFTQSNTRKILSIRRTTVGSACDRRIESVATVKTN